MQKKHNIHPSEVCPETGCRIQTKPEWTHITCDSNYKTSLSVIDNCILFSRPEGYVTLTGIKKFIVLINEIIGRQFPKHTPFILIEDFSNLSGATTEARRHYIKRMKQLRFLKGMVFFGASPLLKISVKLGKRLYRGPIDIETANDYPSAVETAHALLLKEKARASSKSLPYVKPDSRDHHNLEVPIIKQPSTRVWEKRLDDFNIKFTALDAKMLYVTVGGNLKTEYVPMIARLRDEATKGINPEGIVDYTISDITQLKRADRRARFAYVKSLKNWSLTQPFKMFIFVGANRFMRTAISMGRSFMPFKVRVAKNLTAAHALVQNDRQQRSISPDNTNKEIPAPGRISAYVEPYVNELLGYLGTINWELDGAVKPHDVKASHPFFPIFEAVKLIKDELDELFEEKKRAEEKLQTVNEELESRVKARTADLERLNNELITEIKERKQTMLELRQAKHAAEKANRTKSEFLANMSHELRTPLNHIIGFTEIILDEHFGPLNDKQSEHLQDVADSSGHLLSLINDILDLSKVEAGKLELSCSVFDLPQFLHDVLKMIREKAYKHDITVTLEVSDKIEQIQADRRKLRQVMYNLLSNALKFTPNGGSITLSARLRRNEILPSSQVPESSERNDDPNMKERQFLPHQVEISVQDTGIGIKPDDIDRIFNVFEQADGSSSRYYQGTGLGLSLTRKLVELHGGRIWAESPGERQGSVFKFFIPMCQDTPQPPDSL